MGMDLPNGLELDAHETENNSEAIQFKSVTFTIPDGEDGRLLRYGAKMIEVPVDLDGKDIFEAVLDKEVNGAYPIDKKEPGAYFFNGDVSPDVIASIKGTFEKKYDNGGPLLAVYDKTQNDYVYIGGSKSYIVGKIEEGESITNKITIEE